MNELQILNVDAGENCSLYLLLIVKDKFVIASVVPNK